MRIAGLAFTELIGGQSRRETVVSHTPRTGSLLSVGLVGIGGFVTGGIGVTSDFGGGEEQLTSERATAIAINAADFLTFLTRVKRCEQAMINSLSCNFLFEEPHSLIMRTKVNIRVIHCAMNRAATGTCIHLVAAQFIAR